MTAVSVWNNSDGLRVRFGTDQAKGSLVGTTCTYGPFNVTEAILEASDLVLAGGQIDPDAQVIFPAGSIIHRATLIVTETFTSSGAATLDLGLSLVDGTYTGADEDGIDVAIALATLAAGTVVACDGALVGAGTSKALAVNTYLSYDVDSFLYTAGKARLIVEWTAPNYPDQNSTD